MTRRLGSCCIALLLLVCQAGFATAIGIIGGGGPIIQEIDGSPGGVYPIIKFTNATITDNGDGTLSISVGSGVGNGDVSSALSSTTANRLVVMSGTSGKTITEYTGAAGLVKTSASGVPSQATEAEIEGFIGHAAADGTTKGVLSLVANDFDCTAGLCGFDYTNAQKVNLSQPGLMTISDYSLLITRAPSNASYLTRTSEIGLSNESSLGDLSTGLLKITVSAGVATPSTALAGTDYQAPIGYTPENIANKSPDTNLGTSNAIYPTQNAVKTYVDTHVASVGAWGGISGTLSNQTDLQNALNAKQNLLGFTPESIANKSTNPNLGTSDTQYPSVFAVKQYVDTTVASAGGGDIVQVGACLSGSCLDGTSTGGSNFALYDGDSHKGTFQTANLTADRVYTTPNASGGFCLDTSLGASVCTGYQASLGYTPENVANKSSDTTLSAGGGAYSTTVAVKTYVDTAIAGVSTTWGNISGTLSNQTDLQTALNAKVGTTRTLTIQGTTNEVTVTPGTAQDLSTNRTWTVDIPNSAQLHVAKLTNLTTNGVVTTSGGDGTLAVSTQALTQSGLTWNVTAATCIGDANGGTLTVNGSNQIVCAGDDGGGGGTAFSAITTGSNTAATMQVGTGASLAPTGSGTVTANRVSAGGAGLLEVDGSNVPSVAEFADVVTLFGGGTCSGYLKSDGTCDTLGSGHVIVDEETSLAAQPNLKFTGAGITCSDDDPTTTTICNVPGATVPNPLTGTRIQPRAVAITFTGATANVAGPATADVVYHATFPGAATPPITFDAPSGAAPTQNELLKFEVLSADPVAVSWNSIYAGTAGIALPTTTIEDVLNVWLFSWNPASSKWVLIAATPADPSLTAGTLQLADNDTTGAFSSITFPNGSLTGVGGAATLSVLVPNPPSGQTMTGTRIQERVAELTTESDLAPDCASYDQYVVTALAENLSLAAPVCTPTSGQYLVMVFANSAVDTTHTLTWATGTGAYSAESNHALPTETVANRWLAVQLRWNEATDRWAVVGTTPTASALSNPMTAVGDLIIGGSSPAGTPTRVAVAQQFSLNVKLPPYLAVGDGVADDTDNIQAALDAAAAAGGRATVYIPAGEYSVTQLTVPAGVSLLGAGMASSPYQGTRLIQPDGVNLSLIKDACALPTDYWHWSLIKDLQLRKVGNVDTLGSGIEVDCRSGEGLRFEHLLIISFPESGITYKRGGVPIFISDIHVFGNTQYGINVGRTGADNYQMVSLHGISGDSNDLALIRLGTGGAATDGFHLSDIKAEATGTAPVRQPTVILLDTLQSAPVQIENVSVQATGGATVSEVIKVTGGNARIFASHVKCNGCTNLINDQVASTTVAYGTGDSMWFTYSGGRFNRVNATGMAMESMILGRNQTPLTASAGLLSQIANTNNVTLHSMQRSTDTSPTGNFANYTNAAGTALWTVDITGSLTAGTIPAARVSGALSDATIPDLNTLSTGLTPSRCVETNASGLFTSTTGPCGTGGGGSADPTVTSITQTQGTMSPAPNGAASGLNIYVQYAVDGALTIPAPTGSPVNGKEMKFILRSATPQDLTFTSGAGGFAGDAGLPLPSKTSGGNLYDYYTYRFNANETQWLLVGSTQATTPLGVTGGGTGVATLAAHGVLIGQGTNAVVSTVPTSTNQCLLSHPTDHLNNDPVWGTCATANAADITSDVQVWTGSPTWASGEALLLCNTADCTTNYERARLSWNTNVFTIASEIGGTGTQRQIQLLAGSGGLMTATGGIQLIGSGAGRSFVTGTPTTTLTLRGQRSTSAADNIQLEGTSTLTPTTGAMVGVRAGHTFAPTSGTATYAGLQVSDTINQSGATGITRGIYVAPTLTAAGDYRAIAFSGTTAHKIQMDRHPTADTAGNSLSMIAGGATSGATNKNGGNLVLSPGVPTGTGRSYLEKRCFTTAAASGATDGTEYLCGVEQVVRVLTDGSATNVLTLAAPPNTATVGIIDYSVIVTNASNQFQVVDGRVICRLYNSAGTPGGNTCTNTRTDTLQTGTVTVTWAISTAGQVTLNLDSSFTPSTGYPRLQYSAQVLGQSALTVQ